MKYSGLIALRRMRYAMFVVLLGLAPSIQAEISVHASISNPSPRVREEVLLTLEVVDDRSMLEMQVAPWTAPGFSLRPLNPSVERIKTDNGIRILHRQHWAVMPLYAGAMTLQAPSVELRATGQGRFSLTPAPLSLDVRPLNPLLPVDVPVSRLHLSPASLPAAIPRARPFNLSFTVQGNGLSVRGLRHWLDESLHDSGEVRIYPPEIRLVDNIDPARPLQQQAEIRLTFEAGTSGNITLPEVVLPYVDPQDGLILHARLPAAELRSEHPLWLQVRPWLPWGLGVTVLGVLMIFAWRFAHPRWQAARQRQSNLAALHAAATPKDLLAVWKSIPQASDASALHARLNAACYGPISLDEPAFRALKLACIALVQSS